MVVGLRVLQELLKIVTGRFEKGCVRKIQAVEGGHTLHGAPGGLPFGLVVHVVHTRLTNSDLWPMISSITDSAPPAGLSHGVVLCRSL